MQASGVGEIHIEQCICHVHIRTEPEVADTEGEKRKQLQGNKAELQQEETLAIALDQPETAFQDVADLFIGEVQQKKIGIV